MLKDGFTYLLNLSKANDVAKYGIMIFNENACSLRFAASRSISMMLNAIIEAAIITD